MMCPKCGDVCLNPKEHRGDFLPAEVAIFNGFPELKGDLAGSYPVASPKIWEAESIANLAMQEGRAAVEVLEARVAELERDAEQGKPSHRLYLRMVEQRASRERASWHKQLMLNIDLKRKTEQLEQRAFLAEQAMKGMAAAYTEGKAEATVVALVDYAAREIAVAQLLRKDALMRFDGLSDQVNRIQKVVENELLNAIKRLQRDERKEQRLKVLEKEKRIAKERENVDFRFDRKSYAKPQPKKVAKLKATRRTPKVEPGVIDYAFHMKLSKKLEEAAEQRSKKTARRKSRK
jgi:hypothetical protein